MSIPMRRKNCERRDPAFMADVLTRAEEMHVAFSTDAAPYVLPLNFVYTQDKIYFHCAIEGRKLDCLRKNPAVGFSVIVDSRVISEQATTIYKSVVGHGRISLVDDVQEKIAILHALASRYNAHCESPTPPEKFARTAVLCLEIEDMCGKEKLGKGG